MLSINPNMKQLVQRQLEERGKRTPGQPPRPVTTVKSKALHDLQFRASVEGHVFISDERESAGGTDAGPAPLRYFLAGIMMCHQVWCVKSAALLDVELNRLEGEISGFVEAGGGDAEREVERGFDLIKYKVTVEGPNPAETIQSVVEAATRRCPAFVSAARSIPIEVTILHNDKNLGVKTYDGRSK